jgi:hypothetical protein
MSGKLRKTLSPVLSSRQRKTDNEYLERGRYKMFTKLSVLDTATFRRVLHKSVTEII